MRSASSYSLDRLYQSRLANENSPIPRTQTETNLISLKDVNLNDIEVKWEDFKNGVKEMRMSSGLKFDRRASIRELFVSQIAPIKRLYNVVRGHRELVHGKEATSSSDTENLVILDLLRGHEGLTPPLSNNSDVLVEENVSQEELNTLSADSDDSDRATVRPTESSSYFGNVGGTLIF